MSRILVSRRGWITDVLILFSDLVLFFFSFFLQSPRSHFTSQKEAFLLAHIFALTLHLDNFSVDVNEIANQMNLDPAK